MWVEMSQMNTISDQSEQMRVLRKTLMTRIPLCHWVAHFEYDSIDAVGGAPVP